MKPSPPALLGALAVLVPAGAVAAKPVPALTGARPSAATLSGTITSATGRYAGDHGRVVIRDGDIAGHRSGHLAISGSACGRVGHCLSLSGRPVGTMVLTGHPIPDTGQAFAVRAAGRVAPLGLVRVSGVLHMPGFIACGHETMTLTLRASEGTVTLSAQTRPRCASPLPPAGPG
jgi:hypothetical protein